VLGEIYTGQHRLEKAGLTFSKALQISAQTDARVEQQKMALRGLIFIFGKQGRWLEQGQMRESLIRLIRESGYVIKDRPNKPYE
jgi:hypothetical protein